MATSHPYLSAVRRNELKSTAEALLAPCKGILAADEAEPAMGQRLASVGVENTEENRRRYRQILFATPKEDLNPISGVILQHETCYQKNDNGKSLLQVLKVRRIEISRFVFQSRKCSPAVLIILLKIVWKNRHTQLLFATGIERGIHNGQVPKYQH